VTNGAHMTCDDLLKGPRTRRRRNLLFSVKMLKTRRSQSSSKRGLSSRSM
jgi:hypothetical protein